MQNNNNKRHLLALGALFLLMLAISGCGKRKQDKIAKLENKIEQIYIQAAVATVDSLEKINLGSDANFWPAIWAMEEEVMSQLKGYTLGELCTSEEISRMNQERPGINEQTTVQQLVDMLYRGRMVRFPSKDPVIIVDADSFFYFTNPNVVVEHIATAQKDDCLRIAYDAHVTNCAREDVKQYFLRQARQEAQPLLEELERMRSGNADLPQPRVKAY